MIPAKMRELAGTELAKMYRQWARGRAIVVTNCMKEARRIRHIMKRDASWLSKSSLFVLEIRLQGEIKRARQANRDWRRYRRQMHDSIKEGL